jgi:biopolymer transport protein ExbB
MSQEAQQREAEFRGQRDRQAALLQQARDELVALEAEGDRLQALVEENDETIITLRDELRAKQGDFGELFGIARQAAGEVAGIVNDSVVSAQFPGRADDLAALSETEDLPTRSELDEIWKTLIGEMIAQREVVTFTAPVANMGRNGETVETEVTRVGVFSIFANDGGAPAFLKFDNSRPELPGLQKLARNPRSAIVSAAKNVMNASPERLVAGPIDPSRGVLIGLVVDTPNLKERIDQGGFVGKVILVLLAIGLVFGVVRLLQLFMTNGAVRSQARRPDRPGKGNPLGRILLAARESENADVETFELKLDDAIIRESAGLDFGLNLIKLLAAIAPLLGLLGTVTGMIITFQQITLFGTGDPKIMAGGISQALVTTVLGLVAAIPLLFIHSFCASASRGVQQVIEEQSAGIVARHAEKLHKRA